MERSRDLRRTTISPSNGLSRRRQRITSLRDSTEEDSQMKLQEKSGDRDRELPKRRRFDKSGSQQRICVGESFRDNESTDSSDEEYYEDEKRNHRMNQPSLRTLRSSPVLRAVVDKVIGVPVPRRTRSASTRRLHEHRNLSSDGIGENLNRRKSSPATAGMNGSGGPSLSCSGFSVNKKKMKSSSRLSSAIQDDIEIEVAEALFDLMKQSQSQANSSKKQQEKVNRGSTNKADDDVLKRLKAEDGKDENNDFSVQNEELIKVNVAETIVVDSMEKSGRRIEKEKFPGDPAQEQLVCGDGFVNKGKVGSPKESVSPSCVEVNACDFQDLTVTKAGYAAAVIETKKDAKLEINLMAPPLPSSPEKDVLVDTAIDPKVMTQDVKKTSENISNDGSMSVAIQPTEDKIGTISCNQQHPNWKEQKNQSPFTFPISMSGWPGVFPYPGYMPPPQAVLPVDGNTKSSTLNMQLPGFKFSQPRPKRCATHQYIAHNIQHHQQLINKSVSSGPTAPAALSETNLKSSLKQKLIPGNQLLGDIQNMATISGVNGKDKNSNLARDLTTMTNNLVQQSPNQAPSHNLLHAPGFIFPLGQPQTTVIGSTSLPTNLAGSSSMSFNHPIFHSNEAGPYMAILQNNGCPFPISTNIPISSLKGSESPAMPAFNPSFYSSWAFNVPQNVSTSHKQPKHGENNYPTSATITPLQPEKPNTEITRKNGETVNNAHARSYPVQPMNFSMIPPGNKHSDIQQQGSKGRVDLIPQSFALSFSSNASTAPSLNFSSMAQNSPLFHNYQQKNFQKSSGSVSIPNFLPNEQQLIQVRKHIADRMQEVSTPNTIPGSFIFSQVPFQLPKSSQNQTHITFGNSSVPAASFQGQQNVTTGQPCKDSGPTSRTTGPTVGSTISAQETEASVNGSSQKKSPTCRRNVPSMLSACPSQLPELKY